MAEVIGAAAAQRRITAISGPLGVKVTRQLALSTVREAKLLVHRKTGNLGRSIRVERVTETGALVIAAANYAAYVELGTRPHTITPKAAKALAWAKGPSGGAFRRLSGATRTGTGRGDMIFARVVHHPGSKPYPFLIPGAKIAATKGGLKNIVIDVWNGAA